MLATCNLKMPSRSARSSSLLLKNLRSPTKHAKRCAMRSVCTLTLSTTKASIMGGNALRESVQYKYTRYPKARTALGQNHRSALRRYVDQ